ncbi:MAG TPA: hypothetical protein VGE78_07925, partial [Agromyces sp.]
EAGRPEGATAATADAAPAPSAEPVEAALPIIDLPEPASDRKRPVPTAEAEVLLDSVLDALPAPKKAGEGRTRSRRVSTAALSAGGSIPVITRADGDAGDEASDRSE